MKTCRSCRYYDASRGFCYYFRDYVPIILDDSCTVWSEVE